MRLATSRGYAVALVRAHQDLPKAIDGIRLVPCPQQTGKALDCAHCTPNGPMCAMDVKLFNNAAIVFDPHGSVDAVNQAIITRQ